MDSKVCVSTHDLCISIIKVERLVTSRNPFAVTPSGVIVQFGWGQVGHSRYAQSGGGGCGGSVVGGWIGWGLHIMEDGG